MTHETERLRWWQVLGPWPIPPVALALSLWFSSGLYAVAASSAARTDATPAVFASMFLPAAIPATAVGLMLWWINRTMPAFPRRAVGYWCMVALIVAVFVGLRLWMGIIPLAGFPSTQVAVAAAVGRTLSTVVFVLSVLGVSGHRMAVQVRRTNAALALAREQQEQILGADERTRSQVSQLLHDRVQAGIIAACLELQDAADHADPRTQQAVEHVVRRLEELRALDVRRAARALSPDLADTDLQSALDELAAQYAPAMLTTVEVDRRLVQQDSRPAQQVLLGCYRIAEQAILNAAVHGRARHCRVQVALTGATLTVTVDDDGIGMPADEPAPGIGSALTTTWVRILDGVWRREASPLGGVRVTALTSLPSST